MSSLSDAFLPFSGRCVLFLRCLRRLPFLGSSWALLGPFGLFLDSSWVLPGLSLDSPALRFFGLLVGFSWALRALPGLFWPLLGSSWGFLGFCWALAGLFLGSFWALPWLFPLSCVLPGFPGSSGLFLGPSGQFTFKLNLWLSFAFLQYRLPSALQTTACVSPLIGASCRKFRG